jgi:hypothetical protein
MSYDFSSFSQRLCANVFHCILLYTNVWGNMFWIELQWTKILG